MTADDETMLIPSRYSTCSHLCYTDLTFSEVDNSRLKYLPLSSTEVALESALPLHSPVWCCRSNSHESEYGWFNSYDVTHKEVTLTKSHDVRTTRWRNSYRLRCGDAQIIILSCSTQTNIPFPPHHA